MAAPAKENLGESNAPAPISVDSKVFCSVFIFGNLLAWPAISGVKGIITSDRTIVLL
jgi:hypothetical protein